MSDPPQQPAHDNQWDAENPLPPKAPDRLTAYAVNESELLINWRDRSGNEDGFSIFQSADNGQGQYLIKVLDRDVQSFSVLNLRTMTDYSFFIESFNEGGSSFQRSVSASTKQAKPNAPDSMVILITGQSTISIEWRDNSAIEDYFDLEEARNTPVRFYPINTIPTDCTMVIIDSLASNTINWYRIAARNSNGISNFSEPVSVRID